MRLSAARSLIVRYYGSKTPVWLAGAPGIGKSDTVRQAVEELSQQYGEEFGLIDFRASLRDPTDLLGFPTVVDGRTVYSRPSFLPGEGDPKRGLLFLDEIAQAPALMQGACLGLALEGRVGDHALPPGWDVVAASNRRGDRAGANRIITPLLDRFAYYEVEANLDDWSEWSLGAGVHPLVRSFLAWKPDQFSTFAPEGDDLVFATPRSWAMLGRVLDTLDDGCRMEAAAGIVGRGAAAEIEAFVRHAQRLPDLDAVVADPEGQPVPEEPSVLYALTGALAQRAATHPEDGRALALYALRLPQEFQVLAVRDLVRASHAISCEPEVEAWLTSNNQLLERVAARRQAQQQRK
jgi:hypothetical protein